MNVCRWIVAVGLIALSALCVLATIVVAVRWIRTRQRGSGMPLVGGVLAGVALVVLPVAEVSTRLKLCWLPLASELSVLGILWGIGAVVGPDRRAGR